VWSAHPNQLDQMNCEALRLGPAAGGLVPCAIKLHAPQDVNQIPTHFILLCDVSESMLDDHKLQNIKRCAELVVGLLTVQDSMSLITFGETASIHFKCMEATETNKATMCSVLRGLRCDGCTNLSAGLGYVREVCEGVNQKTGLLVLTDGHANRGIHEPAGLVRIVQGLRADIPSLSVHCVAYGTDHNADLLRNVAEESQSSYTIVNTIEDAASAFGDTLGGLMSCVMQNVSVHVPTGSIVHGPQKVVRASGESGENGHCRIELGDVYAGTKPLVLVDIPEGAVGGAECIVVKGMELPDLRMWSANPILAEAEGRQIDIELVKLRYTCTDILKGIMRWRELTADEKAGVERRLEAFIVTVGDAAYDGNPVADLLRGELTVLRTALGRARIGGLDGADRSVVTQRITSLGLGRGLSTPMAPRVRRQNAHTWGLYTGVGDPDEGFGYGSGSDTESVGSVPLAPVSSGFQNAMQSRLSSALRAASSQVPPS
jgi:hypothetical protein